MNVERKSMPLVQKAFYIASFVFLIAAFIYLGTKNYNAPIKELTDQESFTKEYGITSDNLFVYKTAKEILETLNTKTAVIFMAYPENKWSASYAELLNDVAKKFNIQDIYYYNFKKDRSNNNHYYENIVRELTSYLPVLDSQIINLYAPSLIFVKNGEIIGFDDETSIVRGDKSVDDYWTLERKKQKEIELGILFENYLR